MIACMQCHGDVVELLLLHGANINEKANGDGTTSLIRASQQGNETIVSLLLSKGACVHDKTSYGFSSIIVASQKGNVNIVKMFLSKDICAYCHLS